MLDEELTWKKLVEMEPKLQELWDEALAAQAPPAVGPHDSWFVPEGIRARLVSLVGPLAPADTNPLLRTREAYQQAYREILRAFVKSPPKT
jgi:hypothetical protein